MQDTLSLLTEFQYRSKLDYAFAAASSGYEEIYFHLFLGLWATASCLS